MNKIIWGVFLLLTHLSCLKSNHLEPNKVEERKRNINHAIKAYGVKDLDSSIQIIVGLDSVRINSSSYPFTSKTNNNHLNISGLKIALDPGHVANDSLSAILEGKFIKLKHPSKKDSIFFYEADLNYKTTLYLKDSLEKLGAEVFISRPEGQSAFRLTFKQWLQKNYLPALDSIKIIDTVLYKRVYHLDTGSFGDQKLLFHRLFKHLEFERRAEVINKFNPDLTIIIHYNVDVNNKPWKNPTTKNYSMAFVPGAFLPSELDSKLKQTDFVRIITSQSTASSAAFSSHILHGIERECAISPLANSDNIGYIEKYTLKTTAPGVFCRNLAMTRRVKGVLCFLEGFYQDNFDEALLLNKAHLSDEIPNRLQKLGDGVILGINNYLNENQQIK